MVSRGIGWMNHISRKVVLLLVIVLSCQLSSLAPHASAASPGTEAVQGLGSYFLTMPYGAIKMAVALMGGLAGGMGFIFTGGDKATANKIWAPTLGGEYVITPEHIRGDRELSFFGKAPAS